MAPNLSYLVSKYKVFANSSVIRTMSITRLLFILFFFACPYLLTAQHTLESSDNKIVLAGPRYAKPASFQKLWGKNHRVEWLTPVKVPVLMLDQFEGGLRPDKAGGGNETNSLRLVSAAGKEYTIRSIDKSREDVIEERYENTFIEDVIKDGISMSHPYGAFAVAGMQEAAGIYHTLPKLVYVPRQAALDTFNERFGDDLYLFEQRLGGDWSESDNLGNFKYLEGTDDVVKILLKDHDVTANQQHYLKARLFDVLIADWDRHEDNWKWGSNDTLGQYIFEPIPRDRDQAFYTHDGILIDKMLRMTGLSFMQNFEYNIASVKQLSFEERNMDRFFTNSLTKQDWISTANFLKDILTDQVITGSVKGLPPEIYAVSGQSLIDILKSRREQLTFAAENYYDFLSGQVEIPGSEKEERFLITGEKGGGLSINIFRPGSPEPYYSRVFLPEETEEVILYGLGGNDEFDIEANQPSKILVRIVGGEGRDSYEQQGRGIRVKIYDDQENAFHLAGAKLKTSSPEKIGYNYSGFEYNSKGLSPQGGYSNSDRIYLGLGYTVKSYNWKKPAEPDRHSVAVHYSLSQNALSVWHNSVMPNLIGNWDLLLGSSFDAVKWTNFYGTGNESLMSSSDINYHRIRTREWGGSVGLQKLFSKHSSASVSGFFRSSKIINDTARFVVKVFQPLDTDELESNNYAGGSFTYNYVNIDDSILPIKGIMVQGVASLFGNVSQKEFFQNYTARLQCFIPLGNKFSLAIKGGGSTMVTSVDLVNNAEFYEHAVIGGPENFRGYQRERFWGKSAVYNQNELRFITNINNRVMNAKAGLLVFADNGRVWVPGENSNSWHTAYGGGLILSPFRMLSASLTYGVSNEDKLIQVRISQVF